MKAVGKSKLIVDLRADLLSDFDTYVKKHKTTRTALVSDIITSYLVGEELAPSYFKLEKRYGREEQAGAAELIATGGKTKTRRRVLTGVASAVGRSKKDR